MRLHGLRVDRIGLGVDLRRRVEHDPFRRLFDLGRVLRVAGGAALVDDARDLRERHRRRAGGGLGLRADDDREGGDRERSGDGNGPHVAARMSEVEEVPDPRADHEQYDEDQPREAVPVREREVVRDHGEDDG